MLWCSVTAQRQLYLTFT